MKDAAPPSRDHIPAIRVQVLKLQNAMKQSNRAAIDSVSSVELLDAGLSSDSLLRFAYGSNGEFPFGRLADVRIAYTANRARVDCAMVDTADLQPRPLVLTFALTDSLWLLKRFDSDTSGMATGKLPDSTK